MRYVHCVIWFRWQCSHSQMSMLVLTDDLAHIWRCQGRPNTTTPGAWIIKLYSCQTPCRLTKISSLVFDRLWTDEPIKRFVKSFRYPVINLTYFSWQSKLTNYLCLPFCPPFSVIRNIFSILKIKFVFDMCQIILRRDDTNQIPNLLAYSEISFAKSEK